MDILNKLKPILNDIKTIKIVSVRENFGTISNMILVGILSYANNEITGELGMLSAGLILSGSLTINSSGIILKCNDATTAFIFDIGLSSGGKLIFET